ncbi:hypothetical protein ACIBHY_29455 [Nonomuraea sp. NPDC050547]|uniref:hypothetical protein n=1 Tax=Nonomuraea sp. NPDC050547 TaxID=3364368 RepID=UPI003798E554
MIPGSLTSFLPPADPALPQGGPHWRNCERHHTACAYQLGKQHAEHTILREIAALIVNLADHGDSADRTSALREVHTAVRRLGDPSAPTHPKEGDAPMRHLPEQPGVVAAELDRIQTDEETERLLEGFDRDALYGSCADEADFAC